MNEVKFTSGEWMVYDGELRYCRGKVCIIEGDDMPTVIADLNDYFGKYARDANAHLIAAAPELYHSLSKLVAWVDGSSKDAYGDLESARNALAKARGE